MYDFLTHKSKLDVGQTIRCVGDRGLDGLTAGKNYQAINGLEGGLFYDRPYVTVVGDYGKPILCHASRFVLPEKE